MSGIKFKKFVDIEIPAGTDAKEVNRALTSLLPDDVTLDTVSSKLTAALGQSGVLRFRYPEEDWDERALAEKQDACNLQPNLRAVEELEGDSEEEYLDRLRRSEALIVRVIERPHVHHRMRRSEAIMAVLRCSKPTALELCAQHDYDPHEFVGGPLPRTENERAHNDLDYSGLLWRVVEFPPVRNRMARYQAVQVLTRCSEREARALCIHFGSDPDATVGAA